MSILYAIIIAIILIIFIYFTSGFDGFRSPTEKHNLAKLLATSGEPEFTKMKRLGLDGAEYYEARQLWRKNKYSPREIEGVL
jgi:hypothetical protein